MGLTVDSVGKKAKEKRTKIKKDEHFILLAGCPNVGKSTVFNALTGMNQHTGNWPGKTVNNTVGFYSHQGENFAVADLPGTYSLFTRSKEEEAAAQEILYSSADLTVAVCDATSMEKCLFLVLQILENGGKTLLCINLIDEAKRKKIELDLKKLSEILDVPIVVTNAREKKGLDELKSVILKTVKEKDKTKQGLITYDKRVEQALSKLPGKSRFQKLRWLLFKKEELFTDDVMIFTKDGFTKNESDLSQQYKEEIEKAKAELLKSGIDEDSLSEEISQKATQKAEEIYKSILKSKVHDDTLDRKLDKIFSGKALGIPIMCLIMCAVFFLTIYAANYPSELLSKALFSLGEVIRSLLIKLNVANFIIEPLIDGVWKVMAWVVAVMLPPMAIFFPLFTLLEDFGYLPRMAFNLDGIFSRCRCCGKQSLCMAMGFGCNAAGVVGCRIIDSRRERLLAIVTNCFVPCNGRFPTIITIITIFFACSLHGVLKSAVSAVILLLIIVLAVFVTLITSYLLSKTVLKGEPSAFTLELPPYRVPKVGSVIVRSIFDRTLFVLLRAVTVSAPMGLVIWLLANINIGGVAVIDTLSDLLDPIGKLMGLDGIILLAFILGFPANEIVLPIALMCYSSAGVLTDTESMTSLYMILTQNGWTVVTGVCYILFSLFHFPCSTTLMTIKKETGSNKYTALSFFLPTAIGFVLCCAVNLIF